MRRQINMQTTRLIYTGILLIIGVMLQVLAPFVNVWPVYGVIALLAFREAIAMVYDLCKADRVSVSNVEPIEVTVPFKYPPRRNTKGYVYLLQSVSGHYKIGRTSNPDNRLRTFNVKLPFEVEYVCLIQTPDMYALEAVLHERFTDKRINGEWFNLNPEDVAYIQALAQEDTQS